MMVLNELSVRTGNINYLRMAIERYVEIVAAYSSYTPIRNTLRQELEDGTSMHWLGDFGQLGHLDCPATELVNF